MTPLSDAFLDRLASAAVREGLADAVYTTLSTPIGPLVVVQGPHGVLRIAFEGEPLDRTLARVAAGVGPRIVHSDRELATTRDTISAYLEGDDDRLELPVDLSLVRSPVPPRGARDAAPRGPPRRRRHLRRPAAPDRAPARGARGRHRVRDQPDPDRRAVPPRAARPRAAWAPTAAGRSASAPCSTHEGAPARRLTGDADRADHDRVDRRLVGGRRRGRRSGRRRPAPS